jgi:hypothetical protein
MYQVKDRVNLPPLLEIWTIFKLNFLQAKVASRLIKKFLFKMFFFNFAPKERPQSHLELVLRAIILRRLICILNLLPKINLRFLVCAQLELEVVLN